MAYEDRIKVKERNRKFPEVRPDLKELGRKIAESMLKRKDLKLGFGFRIGEDKEENDNIEKVLDELIDQENVPMQDRALLVFYAGEITADLLFERNLHIEEIIGERRNQLWQR